MKTIVERIRLSWFFIGFFFIFLVGTYLVGEVKLAAGALTLFSVNSFLYGFYIAPVIASQKTRIDELQRAIRAEANVLFDLLLKTKKLPTRNRNHIQDLFTDYMEASFRERRPAEGEDEYEALISYCLDYKGGDKDKEVIEKILTGLVSNQQNRSTLAMHLGNKVFNNEWWIMLVLFSITFGFVMSINAGETLITHMVKALLCTGLTMLMVNLYKLSSLTHKKARHIWDPLNKLLDSNFYRMD